VSDVPCIRDVCTIVEALISDEQSHANQKAARNDDREASDFA